MNRGITRTLNAPQLVDFKARLAGAVAPMTIDEFVEGRLPTARFGAFIKEADPRRVSELTRRSPRRR